MITYTPNQSFFSEIKNLRLGCLDTKAEVSFGLSKDKCCDKAVMTISYIVKYNLCSSAYAHD